MSSLYGTDRHSRCQAKTPGPQGLSVPYVRRSAVDLCLGCPPNTQKRSGFRRSMTMGP